MCDAQRLHKKITYKWWTLTISFLLLIIYYIFVSKTVAFLLGNNKPNKSKFTIWNKIPNKHFKNKKAKNSWTTQKQRFTYYYCVLCVVDALFVVGVNESVTRSRYTVLGKSFSYKKWRIK